jgi:hypothetical protein
MTYDRHDDVGVIDGFDIWFDQVTQHRAEIADDSLPDIAASGLHEYNGISTDWRFTYTGRGIF